MTRRRSEKGKGNGSNGYDYADRTKPRRVEFLSNPDDFLCFAFATVGLETNSIQTALQGIGYHLTASQVAYRIGLAEKGRRNGELTQRQLFRKGQSPVVQALVSQIVGNRGIGQQVKRTAVEHLDRKDLYTPRPEGVVTNGDH